MSTEEKQKDPSLLIASIGIIGILLILITGIVVLKVNINVILFMSLIYISIIAKIAGFSIDTVLEGMKESVSKAFIGLVFFLLIGAIIGVWIQCGTVPTLVYYGLNILTPKFFLTTSLIICSIVSFATGTSWGTVATVGIAIMGVGIGGGFNIPLPLVAGSIVSGAWFGDKMSPISDTTVMASMSVEADIYDHLKVMWYTTLPSYIITLIIYTLLGFRYSSSGFDVAGVHEIQGVLANNFDINWIMFIPIVVVLVLSVLRCPAVSTLVIGIVLGVIISVFCQGNGLTETLASINDGYTKVTGVEMVDKLLIRGGINSMMSTFSLGFLALCLGGALEKIGFLRVVIGKILGKLKRVFSLVLLTMLSCILGNIVFGDVYLTIILNGSLYKDSYDKFGLHRAMLSRTIVEATTMSIPLIPWSVAGAFVAGTLGIATVDYFKFTFLNIINPILSLILTLFGVFVIKRKDIKKQVDVA